MERQWIIDRCKEVQADPNGYLDLWARAHYKSTIITFGKTIQDILASHGDDPLPEWHGVEITVGLFSCTRPIAKAFLRQIKREFETNDILKEAFPDIIWENPTKDAPKWSEDDGIVLKRKANPKESTIEAWGVVEGQPTSRHFKVIVYDDMVTIESVRSVEMINKTTEAWELSLNLGTENTVIRMIGTRYHFNDTYRTILSRGSAKPRVYKAVETGADGFEVPVLLSKETLQKKRNDMGRYTYAAQMLLDPVGEGVQVFKQDWIKFHKGTDGSGMNIYIRVDPASSKKKTSDYTCYSVIGYAPDRKRYGLDFVRDRLNLTERTKMLFLLHRKWRPYGVTYEKAGMQCDIEHINAEMDRENYRFHIEEYTPGGVAKEDRIKKLQPIFERGDYLLPDSCYKTDCEGKTIDLVNSLIYEELLAFPSSIHDDMMDTLAQGEDERYPVVWPKPIEHRERYSGNRKTRSGSGWAV
jgi:phage terminase large subunit-like protein